MTNINPRVAKQYTYWAYPEPVDDIAAWAESHVQLCDPAYHSAIIWPDCAPPKNPAILVVGCGTSQAAMLAYTNPAAHVTGIDISAASLAHAAKLKAKHDLKNCELIELDLHKAGELPRKFDLIYATGVLHHLPDPHLGLQALLPALADDGVICAMLYARYGRAGVYMVQEALRRLGLTQTPGDVKTARQVLAALPKWHAAQPYIRGAMRDTGFDGGIVDTFLHAEDHAFTVPEILELAASCGLAFQGWTDNLDYYPDGPFGHDADTCAKIAALPEQEQWAVVELLAPALAAHSFLLRRKPVAIPEDAIPARRHLLNVDQAQGVTVISRSGNVTRLEGFEAQVFAAINGKTKRSAIITQLARGNKDAERRAGDVLARLWRLGHITMSIHGDSHE